MDTIEKIGKTVEEAIEAALAELDVTREQVEIEVIERETKGFLGILGNKPAKVKVTLKFDPVTAAKKFLKEVFVSMGLLIDTEIEMKDAKHMFIELKGESSQLRVLIGKRGQTLDSLQYLVNLVVNKGEAAYISITLDAENYRQRRKETLEYLAHNLAKKAKATRKNIVLEPMNPYERRIIHSALQNDKYVTTHSEGEEPFRYVVIVLKEQSYNKKNNYNHHYSNSSETSNLEQ